MSLKNSNDIIGNRTRDLPVCSVLPYPLRHRASLIIIIIMWNQAVNTDTEVTASRPDIIIKNKKQKTCTLIDVAIPADRNVVQKEAEKKLKYKSLCIEIQRMWNLKCTIIPIIIGATRIVTRSLRKNLEPVPGKYIHYKRQLYLEHHT